MDERKKAQFAEDMEVLVDVLEDASRQLGGIGEEPDIDDLEEAIERRDVEIGILRALVRDIRANYEKQECACGLVNDYKCERCSWMERIDCDLATIGENNHG